MPRRLRECFTHLRRDIQLGLDLRGGFLRDGTEATNDHHLRRVGLRPHGGLSGGQPHGPFDVSGVASDAFGRVRLLFKLHHVLRPRRSRHEVRARRAIDRRVRGRSDGVLTARRSLHVRASAGVTLSVGTQGEKDEI
jgi:hypothetical protein